jgi:hypothetical protein
MRENSEMKPLSDILFFTIKITKNHDAHVQDYGCVGKKEKCALVEV